GAAVAAGEVIDEFQEQAGDEVDPLGIERDPLAVEEHLRALARGEDEVPREHALVGDEGLQPVTRVHGNPLNRCMFTERAAPRSKGGPSRVCYNTRVGTPMPSGERPPDGGPRQMKDDEPGEVASLAALWTARLLRLRPMHGPRPTGQRVRDSLEIPRWALSLGFLLFVLLFLAMLAFFFVSEAHADNSINFDKPTKDWYQGPVRYIITHQEVKAYKSLDTEIDRQNFIDWFWQRRDLVASTPENEFRDRYQQRVFEANRMFSDTSKPGWKTDMGKIYILVGPPDDIKKDLMAKSHRGMVFWTYRRPPFPDLAPNTVISFARDKSGELVISTSPTIDSDVARG